MRLRTRLLTLLVTLTWAPLGQACEGPEPEASPPGPARSESSARVSDGPSRELEAESPAADEEPASSPYPVRGEIARGPDVDRDGATCFSRAWAAPRREFTSFLQAARVLIDGIEYEVAGRPTPPDSEASAVRMLCPNGGCPPHAAWLFELGAETTLGREIHVGWQDPSGGAVRVGAIEEGRCGGRDEVELLHSGWPIVVRTHHDPLDLPSEVCQGDDPDDCQWACFDTSLGVSLTIVTRDRALRIETHAESRERVGAYPALGVRLSLEGLVVDGCGWDAHPVPLALTEAERAVISSLADQLEIRARSH